MVFGLETTSLEMRDKRHSVIATRAAAFARLNILIPCGYGVVVASLTAFRGIYQVQSKDFRPTRTLWWRLIHFCLAI